MRRLVEFETLWTTGIASAKACNGICYHPCCDVWTTKGAKTIRKSHVKAQQWRNLLLTLDKSVEDKKQALLSKMTEEGWRLPAVLNETCQARPAPTFQQQTAFRLRQPDIQPQDLQAGFSSLDFVYPDQLPFELVTPSSIYYFT